MGKITDFINEVYPIASRVARELGLSQALADTCVSQSALESGWSINRKTNAILGIKASSDWRGKVYNAKTREYYNGVCTNISDCFRAYDSIEDSIRDYYSLISNSPRYKDAINKTSVKDCITVIKNGGYATDPNYIVSVCAVWSTIQNYLPKDSQNKPVDTPKSLYKVVGVTSCLNVRKEPRMDAPVVSTLPPDAEIELTFAFCPRLNGFVSLEYIKKKEG